MLVTAARSVEMTATIDHGIYQVRRVPGGLYVRGDSSFWTAHFGTRAAVLANHWLQVPATTKLVELGLFAPGTMARCLQEGHGTLTVAGTTAVDGQRAIVLRDAGDQPGTQPGTLAVAATGPPYPPSPDRLG
jgi:hypothetical protein